MNDKKWTEEEIDALMFRLLRRAYKADQSAASFLLEHLKDQLIKELS